jgi:hypothetical protein
MQLFARLSSRWRLLLAIGAAAGALAQLWYVRDAPWQPAPLIRIDGLSGFFAFATLGGLALSSRVANCSWRAIACAIALAASYSTTLTPAIAGACLLVGLLSAQLSSRPAPLSSGRPRLVARIGGGLRRAAIAAPGLIAAACLLVGYGALALRGALRYDDRAAGAPLDGFVFWFVLLAATVSLLPFYWRPTTDDQSLTVVGGRWSVIEQGVFQIAWLYPLARLYSLGPWNTGWSFATLLLGGAMALWHALSALTQTDERRRSALISLSYLGLALAGLGLGTSAGIAAGCYAVLTYLVLVASMEIRDWRLEIEDPLLQSPISNLQSPITGWLLSGAIPLTAPFVAAWMLVGAGVAGGVALLAGVAWLVVLLGALTATLRGAAWSSGALRPPLAAAVASVILGVGAPLVVRALIDPAIEQLQGGLTPFGDINVWPWVGLAASDAAHTQVTTLPSIAVALLMLVLSALVYLVARLRGSAGAASRAAGDAAGMPLSALIRDLRDEVPWLGALIGPPPVGEERRLDGE